MTTPLETIVLGLLLVVLLSYRRGLTAPLGIRNLLLPMWCPEPTLTCISYSSTRPRSFTWMTCVSLSAEEEELRRLHLHLHARSAIIRSPPAAARSCLELPTAATTLTTASPSLRFHSQLPFTV